MVKRNNAKSNLVAEVLKNFRVIFKSAQKRSHWMERQYGATSPQIWALAEISAAPGLRVADLAKAMSLHQSTVSNLLDKVERKGLTTRRRNDGDQRVVRLYLTAKGRKLVKQTPQPAMSILPDALHKLPANILRNLSTSSSRLVDVLSSKDENDAMNPINRL